MVFPLMPSNIMHTTTLALFATIPHNAQLLDIHACLRAVVFWRQLVQSGCSSGGAASMMRRTPGGHTAARCLFLLLWAVDVTPFSIPGWGRGFIREAAEQGGQDNGLQIALQFLSKNMPVRDRTTVSDQDLVQTANLAIRARRATAWGRAVPHAVFLNDVLPYRHLDEPYEPWRPLFFWKLAALVANATSTTEAAQVQPRFRGSESGPPHMPSVRSCNHPPSSVPDSPTHPRHPQIINKHVWGLFHDPPIFFKPDQTPEIMAPGQVIAAGYASCTGLSIFLASACRAVGIPARVAGAGNAAGYNLEWQGKAPWGGGPNLFKSSSDSRAPRSPGLPTRPTALNHTTRTRHPQLAQGPAHRPPPNHKIPHDRRRPLQQPQLGRGLGRRRLVVHRRGGVRPRRPQPHLVLPAAGKGGRAGVASACHLRGVVPGDAR